MKAKKIKDATGLRNGSAVKSGAARKGLSKEIRERLIAQRTKTAFKVTA